MACLRSASFLFGFLFVMKALWDCTASEHLGHYTVEDEIDVRGSRVFQAQMENIDGARPGYMRKLVLGAKDMWENRSPNPDIKDEFGMNKVTSKISDLTKFGINFLTAPENREDLENSLGEMKDRQQDQEAEPLVPSNFATRRSSPHVTYTRPNHGKHSKTAILSGKGSNFKSTSTTPQGKQETNQMSSSHSSEKNDSHQILIDQAEEEIVGLMNRDHKGMGRRKPPVHNNQPRP